MSYENIINIIFAYIFFSFITGYFRYIRKKDTTKKQEIKENIEKIQNNTFQLIGFILVSITVLMVQPDLVDLADSLLTFSLGFLLLIISILMAEIKTTNFIVHITKRLNYGSLFCLSSGFLFFFVKIVSKINIPFIVNIYLSIFLFVASFIIIDILHITGILKK